MNNFTDKPPTYDIEKQEKFVLNFFDLSEAEQEELKKRVLENKGSIRIMVHPYFMSKSAEQYKHGFKNRIGIVETGFKRILETKSTTPVFLFEDIDEIDNTKKIILPSLVSSRKSLYLVPTLPNEPVPVTGVRGEHPDEAWDLFINKLKEIGVQKIVIGGMYLYVDQDSEYLSGCLGSAIKNLRPAFKVQISNLAHPNYRENLTNPDTTPYGAK